MGKLDTSGGYAASQSVVELRLPMLLHPREPTLFPEGFVASM